MNQPQNTEGFIFFGYEALYGRVGLDLGLGDMTPMDEFKRIQEIQQIYKDKWGYKEVFVKKSECDPSMVLVYVKPNKPYATNFYRELNRYHGY